MDVQKMVKTLMEGIDLSYYESLKSSAKVCCKHGFESCHRGSGSLSRRNSRYRKIELEKINRNGVVEN
jgi:hypothetical protein